MKYILSAFFCLLLSNCFAQSVFINNFIVKENLLKNSKLAIIAADEEDKPIESVNGTFIFSVNGFEQELKFHDGVAVAPQQVTKSTFVYVKHVNDNGTHAKLYYVIKKEGDLNPIKISWFILIAIPVILILIGFMFRRFITIAIVLIVVLVIFNQSKGLHFSTFLETVYDGLKSIFN
ncbi:hypothetical protein GS399_10640 [Pedobacter sp. HMF7647]|uniref:Uncharacterized protein n=1 Tax=Hufsiella arboris TaxID=2695275 RepID=A0A7K1YBL8_9SPHI|nr:hypothetical protein [Hufsiella arboris]MXV51428.1 hypothetical protein [Hufsiella arboris]